MQVNTFSGDVTLRLPDNARGDITFDSFSGNFNSDLPVTLSSSSRTRRRRDLREPAPVPLVSSTSPSTGGSR